MKGNVLSLDPMYSSLHSMIGNVTNSSKMFALVSSYGHKIYLNGYEVKFIEKELKTHHKKYKLRSFEDINFHYKAKVNKLEKRELNKIELEYFSRYRSYLYDFLIKNNIKLVIMHNDLRWNHAIAIDVCNELNVRYLVTEQGLFRPHTTVIDPKGVNANSIINEMYSRKNSIVHCDKQSRGKGSNDSIKGKLYFCFFLLLHKLGDVLKYNAKYAHNNYSIFSYIKRFVDQFSRLKKIQTQKSQKFSNDKKYIFFPMQLENDTQLLVHSKFSNFQNLLTAVEKRVYASFGAYTLLVKKHPNDLSNYVMDKRTILVDGDNNDFIEKSDLVISVNSSVCFDVIDSNTPLILLGEAFFSLHGIGKKIDLDDLTQVLDKQLFHLSEYCDAKSRYELLDFLKYKYSTNGAGFEFKIDEIERVLRNFKII